MIDIFNNYIFNEMVIGLQIIIKMDEFEKYGYIYKKYFSLNWLWELNLKSNLIKKILKFLNTSFIMFVIIYIESK